MKEYLKQLMAHEVWANRTLLEALKDETRVAERARELLGHICSTPNFWLRKVRGEQITGYEWWPKFDADALEKTIAENEASWQDYLTNLPEPIDEQRVKMILGKAGEVEMRIVDVVTQFYTHSFYHRGQIGALFRAAGLDPIMTDYFIWARQRR